MCMNTANTMALLIPSYSALLQTSGPPFLTCVWVCYYTMTVHQLSCIAIINAQTYSLYYPIKLTCKGYIRITKWGYLWHPT